VVLSGESVCVGGWVGGCARHREHRREKPPPRPDSTEEEEAARQAHTFSYASIDYARAVDIIRLRMHHMHARLEVHSPKPPGPILSSPTSRYAFAPLCVTAGDSPGGTGASAMRIVEPELHSLPYDLNLALACRVQGTVVLATWHLLFVRRPNPR
jgi:hypothetical protein